MDCMWSCTHQFTIAQLRLENPNFYVKLLYIKLKEKVYKDLNRLVLIKRCCTHSIPSCNPFSKIKMNECKDKSTLDNKAN
jgi:hypothetical protein